MKKSEIKVGVDYATSYSDDYRNTRGAKAHRVTVLGPARTEREYGRTRSVVPVRFANGLEGTVSTREFREEWAPYAAYVAERQESDAKAAKVATIARRVRLRKARALALDLEKSGVPLEHHAIFDDVKAQSLANFGLIVMLSEREYGSDVTYLIAPFAGSLFDYVFKGSKIEVPADVLINLLGGGA